MHVNTGNIISAEALVSLPPTERAQYVQIGGTPEQVAQVSRATAHYHAATGFDRGKRRAANKAARKSRRNNRT